MVNLNPAIQGTESESTLLTLPVISYEENKNEAEKVVILVTNLRFDKKLEQTFYIKTPEEQIDFPWVMPEKLNRKQKNPRMKNFPK